MKFPQPTSDAERFRMIGELIAKAFLRGETNQKDKPKRRSSLVPLPPWDRVSDELEQRILYYLCEVGESSPRKIGQALNLSHSTLIRRLQRLRSANLVVVSGRTRRTKYQLSDQAC